MKINEVTSIPQTYIATVRVITGTASTTARTTVTADNQQQARMILGRLYGVGNVISVTEVMLESARTDQIQRKATIKHSAIQTQHPRAKCSPVQLSCVSETETAIRVLSPAELQVKSLADQAKRIDQQAKLKSGQTKLAKAQEKLRRANSASK